MFFLYMPFAGGLTMFTVTFSPFCFFPFHLFPKEYFLSNLLLSIIDYCNDTFTETYLKF